MTSRLMERFIPHVGALILAAVFTLYAQPLAAADPEVTGADPPSAEQGTVNLDVEIAGQGFIKGAAARFFLIDDGVVDVVVHRTSFKGSKRLIANIDVVEAARLGDYTIEVRQNGGVGKGTGLFKVLEKTAGHERECGDGIDNDGDELTDCEDSDCWTDSACREDGGRQRGLPLKITFEEFVGPAAEPSDLLHDGEAVYVHRQGGVHAVAGGQLPSRLQLSLKPNRNKGRWLSVELSCEDAFGNCWMLEDLGFSGPTAQLKVFSVIPYDANCPASNATCPSDNVLELPPDTPELMSFKTYLAHAPVMTIEAASGIGGGTAVDAGRCLSILSSAERAAFLSGCFEVNPLDPSLPFCNVIVTSFDDDPVAENGNDRWAVYAEGVRALICTDTVPIGTTTLSFSFEGEKN